MARIYRDAYGVPHVRATPCSTWPAARARLTARDRSWQLEWLRRRATGTTAELLGRCRRLLGRAGPPHPDRRHGPARPSTALGPETQRLRGGVRRRGQRRPPRRRAASSTRWASSRSPGSPWTPLGGLPRPAPALRQPAGQAVARTGPTRCSGRTPRCSRTRGRHQRQQRLGRRRSTDGVGLAADRRRPAPGPSSRPAVYQQVRLACEDPDDPFDVVGFAFPGVPGVQHFAHAGEVAWAITNAGGRLPGRVRRAAAPTSTVGSRPSGPRAGSRSRPTVRPWPCGTGSRSPSRSSSPPGARLRG